MYLEFFGFSEKPFSIAPNPRYLYMSDRHNEAMLHLQYGLQSHGGFLLLTGEVGTGKTTLARSMMEQLPDVVDIAVIMNPALDSRGLMQGICREWKLSLPEQGSVQELFDIVAEHLIDAYAQGRHCLLMIDEAQHLSTEVLEHLRLLTNLETDEKKLLQVLLIGQPELQQKLRTTELRQLAQRITARYHLLPLTLAETDAYIRYRLQVAGALQPIFPRNAVRRVHKLSQGIPRLINLICDRALLSAFSRGMHQVNGDDVTRAAVETTGVTVTRWSLRCSVLLSLMLMVAIGALGAERYLQWQQNKHPSQLQPTVNIERVFQQSLRHGRAPEIAMQSLFRIWGYEASAEKATCNNAMGVDLGCGQTHLSFDEVQRLGQPAMVRLYDDHDEPFYATLMCMRADWIKLQIGNSSWQTSPQWVKKHWGDEVTQLWRLPAPSVELLRPGDEGDAVRWLSVRLAQKMRLTPSYTSRFDDTLKQQLIRFQRQQGLPADGIVGTQTLLALGPKPDNSQRCQRGS